MPFIIYKLDFQEKNFKTPGSLALWTGAQTIMPHQYLNQNFLKKNINSKLIHSSN